MKKIGLFAAGVLFGTAGIKLLSSKDAKNAYAHTTAAALRAKENVMKTPNAPAPACATPPRSVWCIRTSPPPSYPC